MRPDDEWSVEREATTNQEPATAVFGDIFVATFVARSALTMVSTK